MAKDKNKIDFTPEATSDGIDFQEEISFQEESVPQEPSLKKAVDSGIANSLTGQLFRMTGIKRPQMAPEEKARYEQIYGKEEPFQAPEGYVATTPTEKAVEFVSSFVDPIGDAVGGAAAAGVLKAAPKLPFVKKFFGKTSSELATSMLTAKVEKELVGSVMDAEYKAAARKYITNRLASEGLAGATAGSTVLTAQEGLRQYVDKDFNFGSLLKAGATGAAFGGFLGTGLGALGRKAFGDDVVRAAEANFVYEGAAPARAGLVDDLNKQIATKSAQEAKLRETIETSRRAARSSELESAGEQLSRIKLEKEELAAKRLSALNEIQTRGNAKIDELELANSKIINTLSDGTIPLTGNEKLKLQGKAASLEGRAASIEAKLKSPDKTPELELKLEKLEQKINTQDADIVLAGSRTGPAAVAQQKLKRLMREYDELSVRIKQEKMAEQESRALAAAEAEKLRADAAALREQYKAGKRPITLEEQQSLSAELAGNRKRFSSVKEKNQLDYQVELADRNNKISALSKREQILYDRIKTGELITSPKEHNKLVAELEEVQAAALKLSEEKAQTQKNIESWEFETGKIDKMGVGSEQTKPEFINAAMNFAEKEVSRLIDAQVLKPEMKSAFMEKLFVDLISKKGLKLNPMSPLPERAVKAFFNPIHLMNRVDQRDGTEAVNAVYGLVMAEAHQSHMKAEVLAELATPVRKLMKRGLPPEEITRIMQWVEVSESGIPWLNPSAQASSSITRPAYTGPDNVLAVYPELGELRLAFEKAGDLMPGFKESIGHVQGYIPLQLRRGIQQPQARRPAEPGSAPRIAQSREGGALDPALHETDIRVLIDSYAQQATRYAAFSPQMPVVIRELQKLQFLGQSDAANELASIASDVMGFNGGRKALADEFANHLIAGNKENIREILGSLGSQSGIIEDVHKAIRDTMYSTLVSNNPVGLIKQVAQPELIGSAEIGLANVERGRVLLATSKEARDAASRYRQLLAKEAPGTLGEAGLDTIKNKYVRNVEKAMNLPGWFGRQVFNKTETYNRDVIFVGAREQFQKAMAGDTPEGVDKVLDGLLFGEKQMVRKALGEGGVEQAADMYGLIRSYRTNYIYGMANTPSLFRSGAGRYIPFTTWTRNNLANFVADYKSSPKQLARRLGYATALLYVFKEISGYSVPGANPVGELTSAAQFNILPAISDAAEAYDRGGLVGLKDTGGPLPKVTGAVGSIVGYTPYSAAQRISSRYKKSRGSIGETLGLKKSKEDKYNDSLGRKLRELLSKAGL